MGIGSTKKSVTEAYERIMRGASAAHATAVGAISKIDAGTVSWTHITERLIPDLRGYYTEVLPDPITYSNEWRDALAAHAITQTVPANTDFLTDYVELRGAIILACDEAAALVPQKDGKVAIQSLTSDGVLTADKATNLASLRVLLEAIKAAAE